jgi:hypothetical protein
MLVVDLIAKPLVEKEKIETVEMPEIPLEPVLSPIT